MKPLRLDIQAFGPFAGHEQVDFRSLGAHALFLIHGPTGAGKTSLLDAFSFALYGESSGGERSMRHLRSDRADAALRTEVTLEFALGPVRYRVMRAPRQDRPRARGAGTSEMMPTATLDQWDGSAWTHLAAQPARVTELVEGLLGFDCGQFRQVIVLPQGRFRELLTASSSAREQILEQLFQTTLYRQIEAQLKSDSADVKRAAEDLGERRTALLDQHAFADPAALHDALYALAQAGVAEEQQLHVARKQAAAAQNALAQAEEDVRVLDAERNARATLAQLEAARPAQAAARATLLRAQRAVEVRTLVDAQQQALQQRQQAEQELMRLSASAALAAETHAAALAALHAAEQGAEQVPALQAEQASLQALREPLQRLQEVQHARQGLLQREQQCARSLRALEASLEAAQAAAALGEAEYDVARRAAEALPERQQACALASHQRELTQTVQSSAHRLAGLQRDLADCAARLEVAAEEARIERTRLADMEVRWVAGQAARLALRLEDGEACPVCGAHAHPAPARSDGLLVADDTLAAQKAHAQHLDSAWQEARRSEEALRARCAEVEGQLLQSARQAGLSRVPPSAEMEDLVRAAVRAWQKADAGLSEALAEAARVDEVEGRVGLLRAHCADLQKDSVAMQETLAELQREQALLTREHATLEAQIPAALRHAGAAQAVAMRISQTLTELGAKLSTARERERSAGSAAGSAQTERLSAEGRHVLAIEAWQAAARSCAAGLQQQGFTDLADWQHAWRDAGPRAALDQQLRQFDDAWAAAVAALTQCEAAAQGRTWPEIDALRAQRAQTQSEVETRLQQISAGAARMALLSDLQRTLKALDDEIAALGDRFAVVGRLAEVAGGANPRRMTFQRFVLATLLDEVLEAASLRLLRMSRNRFSLRRVLQQVDQRSTGGLDLEVLDAESDTARPVNTLSGGEGFLASLSLALGLAQVVQSRAGGIHMETLFVDEGFGTLDPESLDFAMRTLIDLQREGRLVGIISHVAELRERIDVRLEVRPAALGSRLLQTFG